MENLPQTITPQDIETFDDLVTQCASMKAATSLEHDIVRMRGNAGLKEIMRKPEIQNLILSAAGSESGFLCDRPNSKNTRPYEYEELLNALIPRLLEGYRMTGNEINIISGKGMPVKAGKMRRILEMTNGFRETLGTPQIKDGFALIRCAAKWKLDGETQSIGIEEDDPCTIKIKYNAQRFDTIDKVLGLAQSKLYTRVLTRITGRFVMDEPDSIDITDEVNAAAAPPAAPPTPEPPPKKETEKPAEEEPPPKADEEKHPDVLRLKNMLLSPDWKAAVEESIKRGEYGEKDWENIVTSNARSLALDAIDFLEDLKKELEEGKNE